MTAVARRLCAPDYAQLPRTHDVEGLIVCPTSPSGQNFVLLCSAPMLVQAQINSGLGWLRRAQPKYPQRLAGTCCLRYCTSFVTLRGPEVAPVTIFVAIRPCFFFFYLKKKPFSPYLLTLPAPLQRHLACRRNSCRRPSLAPPLRLSLSIYVF